MTAAQAEAVLDGVLSQGWAPAEIGEAMKELLRKEVPAQKVWGT